MNTKNNRKRTTNKTKQVLDYLQKNGSITSWQAIENFGATRLSSIIYNRRKKYVINSGDLDFVDVYGNQSKFTKYIYIGEI